MAEGGIGGGVLGGVVGIVRGIVDLFGGGGGRGVHVTRSNLPQARPWVPSERAERLRRDASAISLGRSGAIARLVAEDPTRSRPTAASVYRDILADQGIGITTPAADWETVLALIAELLRAFRGQSAAAGVRNITINPRTVVGSAPGRGADVGGGSTVMPYFVDTVETGGSLLGDLAKVIGAGVGLYSAVTRPSASGVPQERSIFDIPGIDVRSPIALESTVDAAACGMSLTNGFHATPSGAAPQAHVRCNPATGKVQWFVPARPKGWTVTNVGTAAVSKSRRRCRSSCSGKR